MQSVVMVTTISGALIFSVALALLIEELIFGGLFRLFFGERLPLNAGAQARPEADLASRARRSGL